MILVVAQQKGGVGKSTLSICLAVEAAGRGQAVLLVDADPQQTVVTWQQVRARAQAIDQPDPPTWPPADHVNLRVAAGEKDLGAQLRAAAQAHHLVVVDCPPRHDEVQAAALFAADLAILPSGPTAPDAWALGATLDLVAHAGAARGRSLPAAIVLCRTRCRWQSTLGARQALAGADVPVLHTELGDRVAYQEALAAGQGVTTYAPEGLAGLEVRVLYDEILDFVEER